MIMAFIDETSDNKFKDYFGLCCAVVNLNFYKNLKTKFQKVLIDNEWDTSVEFKGSYLFSESKGCPTISVDKRIDMAEALLELNVSNQNARMKFFYLAINSTTNSKAIYLESLPLLLRKSLKRAKDTSMGKNVLSLHCDYRSDVSIPEIRNIVLPVIEEKNYTLFEDVVLPSSNFHTVGILYADIVGYLMARIDNISNDNEIFDNLSDKEIQSNGKYLKPRFHV